MQASSGVGLPISFMTPIGYQSGDCGYCKGEDSGASYYALSKKLMPEHYQVLMDRGWRRSGTLCYLPDASRSCCPHYTIRLPASEFHASRDQRQTLYRWNRFVLGDKYTKQASAKLPKSKGEKKHNTNTFDLTTTVHESEESKTLPDVDAAPDHAFTVNLEPDTFTEEKYDLFHDYQQHVHHEGPSEISRAGFKRFLCSSPLERRTDPSGKKLGSYHHCYRLDGRLIAMAVLDLLPHAVSGVYFLYHRDFEKWSLGKLSALRETALALEGGYEYYYMGYYIHSCLKMRYKGTYKPQHVLDFESFQWDPLDEKMSRLMDERKWVSMSRERRAITSEAEVGQDSSSSTATSTTENEENSQPSNPPPNTSSSESSPNSTPESIYPTPSHPIPLDAANSSLSLLELGMPGVLTLSQLNEQIDLDRVKISLGRGGSIHHTTDIVSWNDGEETDAASIKGVIAEFAACLGRELVKGVVVDFSR